MKNWLQGRRQEQDYETVMDPDIIPVATLVTDEDMEAQQQQQQEGGGASSTSSPSSSAPPNVDTAEQTITTTTTTTTATNNETLSTSPWLLSRRPMTMNQCPSCQATNCRTRTETFPTWQSWTLFAILLLVFWPVCWIPLVLESCKRTNHHCTSCNALVGKIDAFYDCCVTRRG